MHLLEHIVVISRSLKTNRTLNMRKQLIESFNLHIIFMLRSLKANDTL
jgi:hypothetical protein